MVTPAARSLQIGGGDSGGGSGSGSGSGSAAPNPFGRNTRGWFSYSPARPAVATPGYLLARYPESVLEAARTGLGALVSGRLPGSGPAGHSVEICGADFVPMNSFGGWRQENESIALQWASAAYKDVRLGRWGCDEIVPTSDSCMRCVGIRSRIHPGEMLDGMAAPESAASAAWFWLGQGAGGLSGSGSKAGQAAAETTIPRVAVLTHSESELDGAAFASATSPALLPAPVIRSLDSRRAVPGQPISILMLDGIVDAASDVAAVTAELIVPSHRSGERAASRKSYPLPLDLLVGAQRCTIVPSIEQTGLQVACTLDADHGLWDATRSYLDEVARTPRTSTDGGSGAADEAQVPYVLLRVCSIAEVCSPGIEVEAEEGVVPRGPLFRPITASAQYLAGESRVQVVWLQLAETEERRAIATGRVTGRSIVSTHAEILACRRPCVEDGVGSFPLRRCDPGAEEHVGSTGGLQEGYTNSGSSRSAPARGTPERNCERRVESRSRTLVASTRLTGGSSGSELPDNSSVPASGSPGQELGLRVPSIGSLLAATETIGDASPSSSSWREAVTRELQGLAGFGAEIELHAATILTEYASPVAVRITSIGADMSADAGRMVPYVVFPRCDERSFLDDSVLGNLLGDRWDAGEGMGLRNPGGAALRLADELAAFEDKVEEVEVGGGGGAAVSDVDPDATAGGTIS